VTVWKALETHVPADPTTAERRRRTTLRVVMATSQRLRRDCQGATASCPFVSINSQLIPADFPAACQGKIKKLSFDPVRTRIVYIVSVHEARNATQKIPENQSLHELQISSQSPCQCDDIINAYFTETLISTRNLRGNEEKTRLAAANAFANYNPRLAGMQHPCLPGMTEKRVDGSIGRIFLPCKSQRSRV